jgi:pimeloyl-ACP methyl ester carboxylesterase
MSRWIFLRGLSRDSRHWGDFPDVFRQSIPDAEVLSMDLPGNGLRNGEPSPSSVTGMLADCRQTLASRGIDGPVNLFAMSLGAMVAVEWAVRYPQEIARCVLINTSLRGFNPFYQRMRPRNYPGLLRMVLFPTDRRWETTVLTMTSARRDPEIVRRWMALRAEHRVSAANVLRQLLAAARYRSPINRPATPLLLLGSSSDRLVNITCSRAIADRWAAPLIEHPTAGHDLPLDDADWVVEQVSHWLITRRIHLAG